jgi:hypothetical protein
VIHSDIVGFLIAVERPALSALGGLARRLRLCVIGRLMHRATSDRDLTECVADDPARDSGI